MPYDIDTEPIIIKVPAQVEIPPSTISEAEWSALQGRVTAVEGLGLVDLSDVDSSALTDGVTLVYDAATETWKPGAAVGRIEYVSNEGGAGVPNVHGIIAWRGLNVITGDPGVAYLQPTWGGTGTANTVARSDHAHSIRTDHYLPFGSTGSFSSGTRSLVSGNVTGLDVSRTYVIKGTLDVQLRGDGTGAGRTRPRITINGNGIDIPEPPRSVAGVQPQYTVRHPGVTVTGVSSVAVSGSIAYVDGDPTWVGGGALTVSIEANR